MTDWYSAHLSKNTLINYAEETGKKHKPLGLKNDFILSLALPTYANSFNIIIF